MIDGKQLIEDLKRLFSNYELDLPYQDSLEILNRTIEALEQPKTDWILCEERLPEENTEVLINRNHNVFKISIGYYNKDFSWYDQCQCHMISDVTAWQPLPQPYKKEGDSDAT